MTQAFDGLEDNPYLRRQVAIEMATRQCSELLAEGVNQLHFYTLNRAALIRAVCESIGVSADSNFYAENMPLVA